MTRARTLKASEADTLRALIDYLEARQALGNLVYIRIHPVHPFTDKFGSLKFAKVRESQKGAPDLLVWRFYDNRQYNCADHLESIAIEVKSPTGKMSDDQKKWQARFEAIGGRYLLIRDVSDFLREFDER